MVLQEFKAWFDGFTEAIEKQPTQKQWARVKERVGVDRWVTPYRPYWPHYSGMQWTATGLVGLSGSSPTISSSNSVQAAATDTVRVSFNSVDAMHAAGKAEAQSMN